MPKHDWMDDRIIIHTLKLNTRDTKLIKLKNWKLVHVSDVYQSHLLRVGVLECCSVAVLMVDVRMHRTSNPKSIAGGDGHFQTWIWLRTTSMWSCYNWIANTVAAQETRTKIQVVTDVNTWHTVDNHERVGNQKSLITKSPRQFLGSFASNSILTLHLVGSVNGGRGGNFSKVLRLIGRWVGTQTHVL